MKRILLLALIALLVVLVTAACHVLGYQLAPSIYPPPADAVPAGLSQTVATRIVNKPSVEREDLAVSLAPTTSASVELYVDGQNFFPRMLADIQAAQSSVHFEEYGFTPGDVANQFVPALSSRRSKGSRYA